MHGYYRNMSRLKDKLLLKFIGGQFLMDRPDGLVFRGEIKKLSIPDTNQRLLEVEFNWLCEPCFGVDEFLKPRPKWVLLQAPLGFPCLRLELEYYYFQRKRKDREERVKVRTTLGESGHFFQKNDPSNLKQTGQDEEFLPFYKLKIDSGSED